MPEPTRDLAMFPLGSVLLPGMPLPLRVFEPRFVAMLAEVVAQPRQEFGVVLIERGFEVGGGDARFGLGTVADIRTLQVAEDSIHLVARGTARVEVLEWLADDPFPRARVRELEPLETGPAVQDALVAAERVVRATLARVSEFVEPTWPAEVELSDDPAVRLWQLVGIAPIGPLDKQTLLGSTSATELLAGLVAETVAAGDTVAARWADGPDALDDL